MSSTLHLKLKNINRSYLFAFSKAYNYIWLRSKTNLPNNKFISSN